MRPLTKANVKDRFAEIFPSVYLTIISIIQGVALGILANETYKYLNNSITIPSLLHTLFSLTTIIVVSYEYAWLVGIFRWTPNVWDSIIPFFLGFLEVGPMFYLTNSSKWWFTTSTFLFMGALSCFNTYKQCKPKMFDNNNKAYNRTQKYNKKNVFICSLSGLVAIIMWYSIEYLNLTSISLEIIAVTIEMLAGLFMMHLGEDFKKGIHEDYGEELI